MKVKICLLLLFAFLLFSCNNPGNLKKGNTPLSKELLMKSEKIFLDNNSTILIIDYSEDMDNYNYYILYFDNTNTLKEIKHVPPRFVLSNNDTLFFNKGSYKRFTNFQIDKYFIKVDIFQFKNTIYNSNKIISDYKIVDNDIYYSIKYTNNVLSVTPNKIIDMNLFNKDTIIKHKISDINFDPKHHYEKGKFSIEHIKYNINDGTQFIDRLFIIDTTIVNNLYSDLWEKLRNK